VPGEVRYYGYPGKGLARSVFDDANVPWEYGGWAIEEMDSHGGWIASAPAMARFVAVLERRGRPALLPAAPSLSIVSDNWYAMGWQVRPAGGAFNWWHLGRSTA
jgi:hypothetical protein